MRYSLDTQTELALHNASMVSESVKLNDNYYGAELLDSILQIDMLQEV